MARMAWMVRLAVLSLVAGGTVAANAVSARTPAPSIAGQWKGPFIGANFLFDFKQAGNDWTGRYWSDKSNKWVDLQNVAFANGVLTFTFVSQPPSTFTLKLDSSGKMLDGSAKFGEHPALPLTLTRSA